MPTSWKARLEYHFDNSLGKEFSGPFNGQKFRQQIFNDLWKAFHFEGIVETGTFRGVTTDFMARNSDTRIFSVESEPRFFHYARLKLRKHKGVRIANADSRAFLENLIADESVPKCRMFFYLDAHWNADLPLGEEVRLIGNNWRDVVIMIDDFEVPDDDGYKFDDYGEGKRLSLEYLGRGELSKWSVYFPSGRAIDDTGIKRGCVILASPSLREEVDKIDSLRSYEHGGSTPTP